MSDDRKRRVFLTLIMACSCVIIVGVVLFVLYRNHIHKARADLVVTAQSQARLIEAIARFDVAQIPDDPGGAEEAILKQITDAHEKYQGFGETGEFTLARREGNQIVFKLRHRHAEVQVPEPVPFDSELAEPMRRALDGRSGTMIGLDYRGVEVAAAYEPVGELGMGIVAKIDLAEVRGPFVKAGLLAAALSAVIVFVGVFLFVRMSRPMVERAENHALALRKEVAERQRAERRLRASQQRLRRVVQNMPIMMDAFDAEGNIVAWNRECERVTGYASEEIIGNPVAVKMLYPDPASRQHVMGRLGEGSDDYQDREWDIACKDGRVRTISWSNISSRFPISGWASWAIGLDVTERKRAEAVLRLAHDELEQRVARRTAELMATNRELESFCHSVSHDLRAPLRGVDGFSMALAEDYGDQLDDKGRDYLKRIRRAAQHMGELIDDLLRLSGVTRSPMRRETVDLSRLAREVAADLREVYPGRQVALAVADGMTVTGDPDLLRLLVYNLLDNAWKFTGKHPSATVRFDVERIEGRLVYAVRDDGAGFDMTYADKLFGPFQRLHSAAEFPGTGIGLATVQRIVHRHGGQVWAEAVVEEGTTFFFTLPDGTRSG